MDSLIRTIPQRIAEIRERIETAAASCGRKAEDIRLMAVTKTIAPEVVNLALQEGIDLIGENRVQEFLSKFEQYSPKGMDVHFIGHLQSNKVKYIIDKVSLIESVDSVKLANEISACAASLGIKMDILIEVNIGSEESKNGFFMQDLDTAVEEISALPNICLKGMMCIPPRDESERCFSQMEELYFRMRERYSQQMDFSYLSMGMSADYELAIRHGSNIIRLGTAIFGQRNIGGF